MTVLFGLAAALSPMDAATPGYLAGTIISVDQKATTRILYYIGNTPITQDDPYTEVTVQLKDTVYVGKYEPRRAQDTLPDDWKPETTVEVRIKGHQMAMRRPGGAEFALVVVRKKVLKPVGASDTH